MQTPLKHFAAKDKVKIVSQHGKDYGIHFETIGEIIAGGAKCRDEAGKEGRRYLAKFGKVKITVYSVDLELQDK